MQNRKLIACKLDTYFFLHSHCPSDPEPEGVRIECTGSDPDNRQLRLLAQGPINREWTKTLREKEQRFGARFDSIFDIEDRLYRENRLYNDTYNEVIRRLNEPTDQHALPCSNQWGCIPACALL